jgi:hypothetical protein
MKKIDGGFWQFRFFFGYTLDAEIMRRVITHDKILKLVLPFFVFIFCVFSYIIGSIFFRKEINMLDKESFAHAYTTSEEDDRKILAVKIGDEDNIIVYTAIHKKIFPLPSCARNNLCFGNSQYA